MVTAATLSSGHWYAVLSSRELGKLPVGRMRFGERLVFWRGADGTAACFADLGNRVIALDIAEKKIEGLKRGEMPIYEPGLKELVERNVRAGRLSFTTSYEQGLEGTEFVFIAVGTPEGLCVACGTLVRRPRLGW